jgi:predicted TIM-barrel fold metal-dependent hydrolase
MFPSKEEHFYSMDEWNCGDLLSMLEENNIALFLGMDQIDFNELCRICENHRKLNIILTDLRYRMDRNLYPLIGKYNNIYIETIGYKVHQGIEEICRKFGANRLVFGSGMPLYSGASAVSMINYARIRPEEKEMIAYKNLEELLGGVK